MGLPKKTIRLMGKGIIALALLILVIGVAYVFIGVDESDSINQQRLIQSGENQRAFDKQVSESIESTEQFFADADVFLYPVYIACSAVQGGGAESCERLNNEMQKDVCTENMVSVQIMRNMAQGICEEELLSQSQDDVSINEKKAFCEGIRDKNCEGLEGNIKVLCAAFTDADPKSCEELSADNILIWDSFDEMKESCQKIAIDISAYRQNDAAKCDVLHSTIAETDLCRGVILNDCEDRRRSFVRDFVIYNYVRQGGYNVSYCSKVNNPQIQILCREPEEKNVRPFFDDKHWKDYNAEG